MLGMMKAFLPFSLLKDKRVRSPSRGADTLRVLCVFHEAGTLWILYYYHNKIYYISIVKKYFWPFGGI